jgi:hypothetical protein
MFRLGSSSNPIIAAARRAVLPLSAPFVLSDPVRRARAFAFVSQLGIRYTNSPLNQEPEKRGSLARRPRAGERAPDVALSGSTLFQKLRGTGFHLLCFCEAELPALTLLSDPLGLVTPVLIAKRGSVPGALVDPDGSAFARYGVGSEALILVRPDGHIATRVPGHDVEAILAYLLDRGLA